MNIAALKHKPIVRGQKEVKVLFGREPVDATANASHPLFKGTDVLSEQAPTKDFIVDRRDETTLDRDIIMARLKTLMKVQGPAKMPAPVSKDVKGAKTAVSKEVKESRAFATIAELMEEEKDEIE